MRREIHARVKFEILSFKIYNKKKDKISMREFP